MPTPAIASLPSYQPSGFLWVSDPATLDKDSLLSCLSDLDAEGRLYHLDDSPETVTGYRWGFAPSIFSDSECAWLRRFVPALDAAFLPLVDPEEMHRMGDRAINAGAWRAMELAGLVSVPQDGEEG